MHSFEGNDNIIVFGAGEMGLIKFINTAERKGNINYLLTRDREEANFSYFERLIDYARNIGNQ